jgi:hypothetical protein
VNKGRNDAFAAALGSKQFTGKEKHDLMSGMTGVLLVDFARLHLLR